MAHEKPAAPIATIMKTINSGVSYSTATTPDGRIRVETPARTTTLTLDDAKDILSPASTLRPKAVLRSPPIETFENDLREHIRDLDMASSQKKTA